MITQRYKFEIGSGNPPLLPSCKNVGTQADKFSVDKDFGELNDEPKD